MDIDEIDSKILDTLLEDAKLTTGTISKKINVPTTTVHNRIKKLQRLGVIKNFTINIDYAKIGKQLLTYIFIISDFKKWRKMSHIEAREKFEMLIRPKPEEIHFITGEFDAMLKIRFKDPKELSKTTEVLRRIDGVERTHTIMVLPFPEDYEKTNGKEKQYG